MLSSGADHACVATAHPEWDEYDWCRHFELDLRKALRKIGEFRKPIECIPGWRMDCGDHCKCRTT